MSEESKNDVVKEARELLSKATPGPWEVYPDSRPDIMTTAKVNSGYMGERHLLSMDKYGSAWGEDFDNEDDANLIARAPELLSALCDEVEQLRSLNQTQAESIVEFQREQKELKRALAEAAIPYEALLADKESRKWIAPEVWASIEQAVNAARSAITPKGESRKV